MSLFSSVQRKRAIAYYRHSRKDSQENSVPIQKKYTEQFADAHTIDIIHEEADKGESGLTANRPGFQRLLNDWVMNPEAPDFDYVLVYNVSRWGRFQDLNEPAHYEYLCKLHGREVVYVSHGFRKEEDKLLSGIISSVERSEAAKKSK